MPSAYSSEHSKLDAADLAKRTGLDFRIEPIVSMVDAFMDSMQLTGLAAENVDEAVFARPRGPFALGRAAPRAELAAALDDMRLALDLARQDGVDGAIEIDEFVLELLLARAPEAAPKKITIQH